MPSARSILLQNSKNHLAILRLISFAIKFEVKFANFTRRDPHPKNAKLKNVRRGSAVAPLECAVGLERAWERKGRRFVSRNPFLSQRKEKGGYKRGALLLRLCLATTKQSAI